MIPARAATILLLITCIPGTARIVHVPQEAPTIQAGLDSLADGDTIMVNHGTYEEALRAPVIEFTMIGQSITGIPNPMIDATNIAINDTTAVLDIPSGARAIVENFRIRNWNRDGVRSRGERVTLRDCIVEPTRYGLRELDENLGSIITLERCQFNGALFSCVLTLQGNSLLASNCVFSDTVQTGLSLISSSRMTLDSCTFRGTPNRMLLSAHRGPHSVTNCTFGPAFFDYGANIVDIGHQGAIRIANNTFIDCQYYSQVLRVTSNAGDSVEVVGNVFERCRPAHSGPAAFGVLAVETPTPGLERGALISNNTFIECSGNNSVDDIVPSVSFPALLTGNHFVRDSMNGLPSIYAGNYIWQPTPLTLRDNVWESCGYAVTLGATADARWNDWGHSTGPYQADTNPFGRGDSIDGPVPFIPWLSDTIDTVEQSPAAISCFDLATYPNPFNPSVTIEYALTREQDIRVEIFDVLGRLVDVVAQERQGVGGHRVLWEAEELSSGVYFARVSSKTDHSARSVKLLLMK